MKMFIALIVACVMAAPAFALAGTKQGKTVDEYGEEYLDPNLVEQVPQSKGAATKKKSSPVEESNVGAGKAPAGSAKKEAKPKSSKDKVQPTEATPPSPISRPQTWGRDGRFRVGFVGPGLAVISRGYNAAMTAGFEGEYFFFEKLSAGLRFEVATKFKSPTWISIVPRARYVFDLDNHPRWAIYAQAGVGAGISAGNGSYAAVDISIPGGGFWWQWTDRFSVGADTNLHIFARSEVTVGWTLAPAIRYIF